MPRKKTVTNGNTDKPGRPGGRGGTLRTGNPGNRGGGNTPKAYKLWLGTLLHSEAHRRAFEAQITDGTAPNFAFATRHAAETTYGKAPQRIEVEDTTPREALTLEAALVKVAEMARAAKALGLRAPLALPPIPEAEVEDIPE